MTLATTLRNAARSLIETFGNTITVYSYSESTKTENEEGDITVSDWSNSSSEESFAGALTTATVAHIPVTSWTSVQVDGVDRAYTAVLETGVVTPDIALSGGETLVVTYKYDNDNVQSVKSVDGENAQAVLDQATQGRETIGADEKTLRDDTTIAVNDRLTADGTDFRVTEVRPIRTQDTLVISIIRVARVKDTTNW